jgi:hypothetical protein
VTAPSRWAHEVTHVVAVGTTEGKDMPVGEENAMDQVDAPCSDCLNLRRHNVLAMVSAEDNVFPVIMNHYRVIQCAGCGEVSFSSSWSDDDAHAQEQNFQYFPSPVSRQLPRWLRRSSFEFKGEFENTIAELFKEVYAAVRGGQYRLAAMGVRSLLEQIMISQVGDQGGFASNLKTFLERGFISQVQREAMNAVVEAGHAVIHRKYKPSETDLNTALDITEGIAAAIFRHVDAAVDLSARVPKRTKVERKP